MKIIIPRIITNSSQLKWDWSGTVTNLKSALSKKVEVEEKNLFFDFWMFLNRAMIRFRIKKADFNSFNIIHQNRRIRQKTGDVYLSFDEFPLKKVSGVRTYIYQDLCVVYLKDIAKAAPELFRYSGFQGVTMDALEKRYQMQADYYSEVDKVFTMSHWLKDYMLKNKIVESDKLVYVGGGINLDIEKIDLSAKTGNKFLFVGKDFIRKGGPFVYESFCYLQQNLMPEAELYIIGPESLPYDTINKNTYFLGELDSSEVTHYFNLCDVFVMPSHFEAFGLVFIEALTFGLPCIGRNRMEMPYLIDNGETGLLINENETNPQVLAEMMYRLIKDDNIKEKVYQKRNYYLSEYTWDKVADRMLRFM